MRITHSDPQRLTIVDFPYVIGLIAWPCAALMAAIAIVAALNKRHPREIVGPIAAAVMFCCGGGVFTKRSVFDFDFGAHKLTWSRRGLFTRQGAVVPLKEIHSALLEAGSAGDSVPTYRVVLLLATGDKIPLTEAYSAGEEPAESIRRAINDALHVTTTQAQEMETDILELARAGRTIDAIKLARTRYGYDLTQAKQFVDGLSR